MACCIGHQCNGTSHGAIICIGDLVGGIGREAIECNSALRTTAGGWVAAAHQVGWRSSFGRSILITYSHKHDYKTGCQGFHFSKLAFLHTPNVAAYERDILRENCIGIERFIGNKGPFIEKEWPWGGFNSITL